jgi:putative SOS response-associated peptidase YedK
MTGTMVTTEPDALSSTPRHRVPLALERDGWVEWIAEGKRALAVNHQHPDSSAFAFKPLA